MSTFTTSIEMICNQVSSPIAPTEERVRQTADFIFNFPYTWYARDGTGRDDFERMFVRQYFLNEIAFETLELFRMKLKNTLEREMPRYRQLYESSLLKFDPLVTIDVTTNGETEGTEKYTETNDWSKSDSGHDTADKTFDRTLSKNHSENTNDSGTGEDFSEKESTSQTSGQSRDVGSSTSNTESTTTHESTSDRHSETSMNVTDNKQSIHSDNPQTNFAGHDYASKMDRSQNISESSGTEQASDQSGGMDKTTGETSGTTESTVNTSSDGNENARTAGSYVSVHVINTNGSGKEYDTYTDKNDNTHAFTSSNEASKDGDRSSQNTHTQTEKGYRDSPSSLLLQYRETFLNINEMLLNDCGSLFLKIYRSGYEQEIGGGYYGLFV